MAKLLVFDHDKTQSDSERDYIGCYKKGYIVEVFEDSKPHVDPPQPPFLILQITDKTKADVLEYMKQWERTLDYAVVARDEAQDGWRLDLTVTNPNPSGKGKVTLAKVQDYFEGWGAQNVGLVGGGTEGVTIRFDITIGWILRSKNFWGHNPSLLTFNELSYDQVEGIHRTEVNYSAVPMPPKTSLDGFEDMFENIVKEHGGYNITNDAPVITFDIARGNVINYVRGEIRRAAGGTICRRKKYLDPAFAQQIIDSGRFMARTAAQVAPYVRDRETE